jgi:hypothetical protein
VVDWETSECFTGGRVRSVVGCKRTPVLRIIIKVVILCEVRKDKARADACDCFPRGTL